MPHTAAKYLILLIFCLAAASGEIHAQRIAVIEPDKENQITLFADSFRNELAGKLRVLDDSLAESAFRSVEIANHFNLTSTEAKRIGGVIGCDHFVLVRSTIQRRESLDRSAYYEAYAVIYVVNSRSGRLDGWILKSVEGPMPEKAEKLLLDQIPPIANEINSQIRTPKSDLSKDAAGKFEEVPPDSSPLAKGLKPPIPYRRLKPEYTPTAFLYGVRATVEIEADIAADGKVERTSVERWAGYGLDESVDRAVRSMNWHPAMRDGKPLPMRVLLRYNFTKIEKEDEP